jgi:DNA helicase-2/ATP-dependent DNA helicase PcrA
MEFIADLHIHSYLSRATSKQMNLENLYKWAQLKGISVIGTGDFTHPVWFSEIEKKLEPAEPGLFKLKKKYRTEMDKDIPKSCKNPVRFMLSVEISNIYKKNDKVRKVHSLIYSPDLASADRLNKALDQIGNIKSDGRPIIGMHTKDLLQMALDSSEDNVLIPAHIWTPWFSVLGASSGFDSIEECFEDLTPHIFALETGLSSDPPMNWMISDLDRFVLVSNSDAHSPSKLAREANIFTCEMSYFEMMETLRNKKTRGFAGTLEFFPEEGKYFYDGHRNCQQRMSPEETMSKDGKCPQCGKKVTVGVLHRVSVLADRKRGFEPKNKFGFESIIPLAEIIAGIHSCGVNTKKVTQEYMGLLETFGSELYILRKCPVSDLKTAGFETLSTGLDRMRSGRVSVTEGYDGEFGIIDVVNN